MHFVCSPFGSSGDVHPMVALALALRQRGHRVTLLVNRYFEGLVRRYGLDFEEFGTAEEFLALARRPEVWQPLRAFPLLYREGVLPTMRRHHQLLESYAAEGDVAAITNLFGFGALVARETLGIPVVTMHLQPAVILSEVAPPSFPGAFGPRWLKRLMYRAGERWIVDRVVLPSLNQWRQELGLDPVRRTTQWWNSPDGVACFFPDWFARPQVDWPGNLIQTGFPLWDEPSDTGLSNELEAFLAKGSAPLAWTPGSLNVFGREFFEAGVDACRRLGRRGLLLTRFADQVPADLREDILHVPYAPFSELLPRCAALVHHGGVGSMSQAMAAGIPQLIVALAHDQFDNAERVRVLGIGSQVSSGRLRGSTLAKSLAPLLESPAVSRACQVVASRLRSRDAAERMAVEIERRCQRRQPLPQGVP